MGDGVESPQKVPQTSLVHGSITFCRFTLNERPELCLMDRRLVGEGEKEEEEEEKGSGDDGDEMGKEEEVNEDDLLVDANVEKVNACCTCCVVQKDALWLKYIPHSFHVAACKCTCIAQLSFTRIVRGIPSEKEEMEEGGEGGEGGEQEEDMFDKETELGLIMYMDFWVSEEESVAEDVEVMGFGEVPVRTEVEDNWVWWK
ncbi:uncharacterized protein MONOS_16247 [Monocercomonoides exilis]|uniref:uncharacterized protein n=2 Tax=Monocercomonoides exilis TaxID=2049356 RepID=UPI00355A9070|nr:hypothetical protein MONOS_16247 [Monocercomonoides exilis]|eukprot:MONOS_16247.1-p1 / transcript=MONOS_16247.1 / gene=MONOS_16247 / organism=Monocercomonoides_exilis_PA203 / gene_product=unspecified product / transcript_product=unspecified product / location=Mono_scaffold01591:3761-4666(-) / protein_length=201 / sequence_SO=supercontig / SO=protein_coding / is_pseudo=false